MGYRILFIVFSLFVSLSSSGQENPSMIDSTFQLEAVKVEGFSYNRPVSEVPAPIAILGSNDLQRFSNASLLPAFSTIPGVRMEERSPGSYRLAIRGSSLRSPFGVRNVKVYWNGLPFTDAGGNTYLNLLDFNSVAQAEVIKGPGSSLYGAGTGGVVLLKSEIPKATSIGVNSMVGSFGMAGVGLNANLRTSKSFVNLRYQHLESEGYREHTSFRRDVLQGHVALQANKNNFQLNLLLSDLEYETPGALTLQQFQDDPRQARPAGGPNRGAVEQKAAIYNKSVFVGLNHAYDWNDRWTTESCLYGSYTDFKNPAIRNFEERIEKGIGGRLNNSYTADKYKVNFGAEYQYAFSPIKISNNDQGTRGTLQSADEITTQTYFAFGQVEFFLPSEYYLTLGASLNKMKVDFSRLSETPSLEEVRDYSPVFSPRIALLKKFNSRFSAYVSFSRGYSPPTIQELYPSTAEFDEDLRAEQGTNYELGFHGSFLRRTVSVEASLYSFRMDETIAIRRTEDGAEYFVNSGETQQNGIETKIDWQPTVPESSIIKDFKLWTALTFNDYTFQNFLLVTPAGDSVNISNKSLTGVPPRVYTSGADLRFKSGPYVNVTLTYTDDITLNDEHTFSSESYSLLYARLGYKRTFNDVEVDIFAGVDNALDEKYSLGNDLNAVGSRFYNAAPGRNYFGGLKATWIINK